MRKIKYNNSLYDIIDIINFHDTYHLIIKNDKDVLYINKEGDKYYTPLKDLSLINNKKRTLEYLRKQYVLNILIDYIKENEMYDNINDVTEAFKEYVKTSYVETFLYWPFMTDIEFNKELRKLKIDLYSFINQKLHNRVLSSDRETIIIIDNYVVPTKFEDNDEFIPDPSFKK